MTRNTLLLTTILALLATPSFVESATADDGQPKPEKAIFAGGCFWCMEKPFDELDGVHSTVSGYLGGQTENPTYREVSTGRTGHAEAVEITYDPAVVTYEQLLEVFWRNIDPLNGKGQFCDYGNQYRSEIFYLNIAQKEAAGASLAQLRATTFAGKTVATGISAASPFYPAEEYHQDYYLKNPVRYQFYRYRCGRDRRLEELWGKAAR